MSCGRQKRRKKCLKSAAKSAEKCRRMTIKDCNDMKQTKVTLREKPIKGGAMLSLYLDYYPAITHPETGKPTRREFLNIHVEAKPRTAAQRRENANKRDVAEAIRARRQVEVADGGAGFLVKQQAANVDFLAFFRGEVERQKRPTTRENYDVSYRRFVEYMGGVETLPFSELNRPLCDGFREYLETLKSSRNNTTPLSPNTTTTYFKKFKAVLHAAFKKELTEKNFAALIGSIKPAKTEREFLTGDEVRRLIKADCYPDTLKRAALFSIFTGLRISDVRKLTWGEVQQSGGRWFLQYRQQKTGNPEILPLPSVAVEMLGERAADEVKPFEGVPQLTTPYLEKWMAAAGITKHITFHCFRHTAATLLIERGVDIYTVQKILGHADVATTQIYARMLDDKKRAAMETINFDLTEYKH